MKYDFQAPHFLDEEQVKYLVEKGIITVKDGKAIWIFNPKACRELMKVTKKV
jgi:hypothetical protein